MLFPFLSFSSSSLFFPPAEKVDHVSDQSEYVSLIASELEEFMDVYRSAIASEAAAAYDCILD